MRSLTGNLNFSPGVAVDSNGNVYVTDGHNGAIKEFEAVNGVLPANPSTRTVSSAFTLPSALAIDNSGDIFVTDQAAQTISEIVAVGGVIPDSPAIRTLYTCSSSIAPYAVAVDASGDVFYSASNSKVYELVAVSGLIPNSPTPVEMGGGFHGVLGIALDNSGNIYLADASNNTLDRMPSSCTAAAYAITPCTITVATLPTVAGAAIDTAGNIFVTDSSDSLQEILAVGGSIPVSPAILTLATGFNAPVQLARDKNGDIFVADQNNNQVVELFPNGFNFGSINVGAAATTQTVTFTFTAGGNIGTPQVITQGITNLDFQDAGTGTCTTTNGSGHTYNAGDTCTVDVAFTPLYPGLRLGAVQLVDTSGNVLATSSLSGIGTAPQLIFTQTSQSQLGADLIAPAGVAADGGSNVYVTDFSGNTLTRLTPGCTSASCMTRLGGGFNHPIHLAIAGDGTIYVGDSTAVRKVPSNCFSSSCVTTLGGGFSSPYGVALDGNGNIYIADQGNSAVKQMSLACTSASCVTTLGGGFIRPTGIAVDTSGNVYVADTAATTLFKMPPNCYSAGCVTSLGGGFSSPTDVVLDPAGDIYISNFLDTASSTPSLQAMAPGCASSSCVTTIASGYNSPFGIAIDSQGNLYVGDAGQAKLLELVHANSPSHAFIDTLAGSGNSSDSPWTVTLQNIGNAALTFPVPAIGTNPSLTGAPFILGTGTGVCPAVSAAGSPGSLNAGATCTLPITFAPTSPTTSNGTLVLTDNSLNAAGPSYTTQTISFSGRGIISQVTQIIFTAAPTSSILAGGSAGSAVTAAVADQFGNPVTTINTGTATLTVTGPNGYSQGYNTSFVAGIATFNLSTVALTTAGQYSYTVTGDSLRSTASLETVSPASAALILFTTAPASTIAASGNAGSSITAAVRDRYGNLLTTLNTGSATLTVTGPGGYSQSYTAPFANGIATFNLSAIALTTAGQYSYTVTGDGVTSAASLQTVTPLTATHLSMDLPSHLVAGAPTPVTLLALDVYGNTASSYVGPASLTTTDSAAAFSATSIPLTAGSGSFTVTFHTLGSQNLTATDAILPAITGTAAVTIIAPPAYVVTVLTDTTSGVAGNCVDMSLGQSSTGGTDNTNCSLRDALTAVNAITAATTPGITFQSGLTGTIALNYGPLAVANSNLSMATITGPGAARLTITGSSGAPSLITNSPAAISGITFTGGGPAILNVSTLTATGIAVTGNNNNDTNGAGAGIANHGTLTLNSSAISANSSNGTGGGIYNDSTLTVSGSTISGNSASSGGGIYSTGTLASVTVTTSTLSTNNAGINGGGIYNSGGAVALTNTTLSGNNATNGGGLLTTGGLASLVQTTVSNNMATSGGGILNNGTLTAGDSIVKGNLATVDHADLNSLGSFIDNGGNAVNASSSAAAVPAGLAPLGNYGGPTRTMLPLPGSPSICTGTATAASSSPTDQRGSGFARTTTYGDNVCSDAGAVQTHYSIAFTQSPSSTPVAVALTPAPAVQVSESGSALDYAGISVTLAANSGTLNGTASQSTASTGIASFSGLSISPAASADTLNATLQLSSTQSITVTSAPFSLTQVATTTSLSAGSTSITPQQSVTLTATVTPSTSGVGTPGGNVQFLDGAAVLATVALNGSGVATFAASSLAPGTTHTLSAVYLGNAEFLTSTSPSSTPITVTVAPLEFTFSYTAGSLTINPGQSGNLSLSITPAYGSFANTVTFSVTGLPTGATASFNPTSLPANSTGATVTLTITLPSSIAANSAPHSRNPWPIMLGLLLLPLATSRRFRRSHRRLLFTIVLLLGAGATSALSGCNSSGSGAAQSYNLTVTASSGTIQHNTSVMLNVP